MFKEMGFSAVAVDQFLGKTVREGSASHSIYNHSDGLAEKISCCRGVGEDALKFRFSELKMNEKPTDIATTADRHHRWAELSKKYKCSNSTEKFKCFEEALLEAIVLIREQGHNPKVLFELFLQLQDKKDGRKATLLDK